MASMDRCLKGGVGMNGNITPDWTTSLADQAAAVIASTKMSILLVFTCLVYCPQSNLEQIWHSALSGYNLLVQSFEAYLKMQVMGKRA